MLCKQTCVGGGCPGVEPRRPETCSTPPREQSVPTAGCLGQSAGDFAAGTEGCVLSVQVSSRPCPPQAPCVRGCYGDAALGPASPRGYGSGTSRPVSVPLARGRAVCACVCMCQGCWETWAALPESRGVRHRLAPAVVPLRRGVPGCGWALHWPLHEEGGCLASATHNDPALLKGNWQLGLVSHCVSIFPPWPLPCTMLPCFPRG